MGSWRSRICFYRIGFRLYNQCEYLCVRRFRCYSFRRIESSCCEVKSMEELETLGKENIEGKIVFFNRPMQPDVIHTFEAYGSCANQRYSGALEASKYGAVGVLVRSLSLRQDNRKSTRLNSSHVRISYAVFCLKKKKTKKK